MSAPRVRFVEAAGRIDLSDSAPGATIGDLIQDLEAFRLAGTLRTAHCAGCGECCRQPIPVLADDLRTLEELHAKRIRLPSPPDRAEYARAVEALVRDTGVDERQARELYEYNNSEPVILERTPDGSCVFLRDGYCSIYEHRPLACRIYLCNMGERLEVLQEQIVSRGTWHLYAELGWVDASSCAPNPFGEHASPLDIPLSAFSGGSVDAMEKLFFYF